MKDECPAYRTEQAHEADFAFARSLSAALLSEITVLSSSLPGGITPLTVRLYAFMLRESHITELAGKQIPYNQ
jgi:hypothetical protein